MQSYAVNNFIKSCKLRTNHNLEVKVKTEKTQMSKKFNYDQVIY